MKPKTLIIFILLISVAFPLAVFAGVGVGVGTGKIIVNEPLKPGGIYNLPPIMVFNTGDENSDYAMFVQYHEGVPELRPAREWFVFDPHQFNLDGGKSQQVNIKMNLPMKTTPGDYFAYLEARPVQKGATGTVSIGIAAASKLYFKVIPANLWQAITFRISSFFKIYAPWPWISLVVVILAIIIVVIKRTFSFQFGISKKG